MKTISSLLLFPEVTHTTSCSGIAFPTHKLAAYKKEGFLTLFFHSSEFLVTGHFSPFSLFVVKFHQNWIPQPGAVFSPSCLPPPLNCDEKRITSACFWYSFLSFKALVIERNLHILGHPIFFRTHGSHKNTSNPTFLS
jgi:hypothetical protein